VHRLVKLADGTEVLVRPIEPGDKGALQAGFERLGRESRYLRFLAPIGRLSAADLRYLTEVDHHDHEALVALERATDEGIGVARFVRLPDDRRAAEFAVAVADDWQGRGAGTVLLGLLADRAREEGVERFRGLMLARNQPVQDLLGLLGEPRVVSRGPGTVEVEVDLPEDGTGERLPAMLRAAARGDLTLRPREAVA
jgi:GNAT superfamily N-acetyltransferase